MTDDLRPLFRLFETLPRGGPGDDDHTREALRRLPALPAHPRVLDLGCGPGQQTLVLARELGATVEAIDVHRPFLDALEREAERQGLADLITTRVADMGALELEPGSVDLIWCEGAIFLLGFEQGLRRWRPHLKPGGLVVASEATWFTAERPEELRAFWAACYPGMASEEENEEAARRAGYETLDRFRLPREIWWSSLYDPLQRRIEELREEAAGDPALAATIVETEQEMEMHRRHGDRFGYTYFLLQRTD